MLYAAKKKRNAAPVLHSWHPNAEGEHVCNKTFSVSAKDNTNLQECVHSPVCPSKPETCYVRKCLVTNDSDSWTRRGVVLYKYTAEAKL